MTALEPWVHHEVTYCAMMLAKHYDMITKIPAPYSICDPQTAQRARGVKGVAVSLSLLLVD